MHGGRSPSQALREGGKFDVLERWKRGFALGQNRWLPRRKSRKRWGGDGARGLGKAFAANDFISQAARQADVDL
jgi:hypothetical protein